MNLDLTTREKAWAFFNDQKNVEAFLAETPGGANVLKTYQGMGWAPLTPSNGRNGHKVQPDLGASAQDEVEVVTQAFVDPLPHVPAAMKAARQWVLWKLEPGSNGRMTKVPYRVDGRKASSTNPDDWTDYETAVTGVEINSNGGVGFVFANGFMGIDLDGCRNPQTEEIKPWADEIAQALDAYVEISPSGMGLHVFALGNVPGNDKKFNLNPAIGFGDKVGIEVYDKARFFTVTGDPYFEEVGDVAECSNLTQVYEWFHQLRRDNPLSRNEKVESANSGESAPIELVGAFTTSKYDIFTRGSVESVEPHQPFVICDGIGRLTYPSHSEADMAFMNVAAHVHDGDADKMWDKYAQSPMARNKWLGREADFRRNTIAKAIKSFEERRRNPVIEPPAPLSQVQIQADAASEASRGVEGTFPKGVFSKPTDAIPPFDDSMLVGVIRKLTDALCVGTTIPRQYGAHVAKVVLSAIMTRYGVSLDGCDSARSYFITFGDTGTGKGEAFRRMGKLLDCLTEPFVLVTDTIDSEAGMRDAFFDILESQNRPILYFVDEVKTLGQKADGKKNPEIVSGIIEMANKTTVSRTKAKRGKNAATKTRKDAWLLLYACAQDGEAFATAFPRTAKQGLPDRFIPEYSGKVESGDLPEPSVTLGLEALAEAVALAKRLGGMSRSEEARVQFESIWQRQSEELRKSPRLRQQFLLELYFAAFARGSAVAEAQDLAVATKWFERQKAIRTVFFSEEIPDQVGVYVQRLRKIMEGMLKDLRKGKHLAEVALSFRDLATQCLAYKDNDMTMFKRAWEAMIPFFVEIPMQAANGHVYQKVVPVPAETDMWLPAECKIIHPNPRG